MQEGGGIDGFCLLVMVDKEQMEAEIVRSDLLVLLYNLGVVCHTL